MFSFRGGLSVTLRTTTKPASGRKTMSDEHVLALVQTVLHYVSKGQENPWPADVMLVYRQNLMDARRKLAVTKQD